MEFSLPKKSDRVFSTWQIRQSFLYLTNQTEFSLPSKSNRVFLYLANQTEFSLPSKSDRVFSTWKIRHFSLPDKLDSFLYLTNWTVFSTWQIGQNVYEFSLPGKWPRSANGHQSRAAPPLWWPETPSWPLLPQPGSRWAAQTPPGRPPHCLCTDCTVVAAAAAAVKGSQWPLCTLDPAAASRQRWSPGRDRLPPSQQCSAQRCSQLCPDRRGVRLLAVSSCFRR